MIGKKDDQGKLRYDLLPVEAEREIIQVLTFGAAKYGDENWRRVSNARKRYAAAARRHMADWMRGERLDPESGLPHLAHCACCVIFLQELDRAGDSPVINCNNCRHSHVPLTQLPCAGCGHWYYRWEPQDG